MKHEASQLLPATDGSVDPHHHHHAHHHHHHMAVQGPELAQGIDDKAPELGGEIALPWLAQEKRGPEMAELDKATPAPAPLHAAVLAAHVQMQMAPTHLPHPMGMELPLDITEENKRKMMQLETLSAKRARGEE